MAPEQGRPSSKSADREMTAWIQGLSKAQLIEHLEAVQIDATGTMDDLRRLLRDYVRKNPHAFALPTTSNRGSVVQINEIGIPASPEVKPEDDSPTDDPPNDDERAEFMSIYEPAPVIPRSRTIESGQLMDRVRKWGCHFDGKDAFAFLERLNDLREAYGVTGPQLLRSLPELLRGDPLLWYRNNRHAWGTWTAFENAFRRRYLPLNVSKQLRRSNVSINRAKPSIISSTQFALRCVARGDSPKQISWR